MPMMQGAAVSMGRVKPVEKEVALATAYKLDGALPIDLRKWTSKKQSKSCGGIPMEKSVVKSAFHTHNQSAEDIQEKMGKEKEEIEAIFKDGRTNLAQREKIAHSILAGEYQGTAGRNSTGGGSSTLGSPGGPEYEQGHLVKHQFEKDLIRGTGRLHRARMKPEAFLSATGTQAPIVLVEPRMVMLYEMEKNVARVKTPGAGKEGHMYTFAGKYVEEEVKHNTVSKTKQELDRILASKFVADKKKMWEHSRKLHIARGRKENQNVIDLAKLNKKQQSEKIVTQQERKKYIDEFRSKLRDHLVQTKDPLIGTIMRYVNEKIAWDILQQYKGYSMSMKAIVGLVGQTLGDLEVDPEDEELNMQGADEQEYLSMDRVYGNGNGPVDLPSPKSLQQSQRASPVGDGFEGENVYLTGLPSDGFDGPDAKQDENGDKVLFSRPVDPPIKTTGSINDSIQETIDNSSIGDLSFIMNNQNRLVKPNSAGGKYYASSNVFAPKGVDLADKLLPHNNELSVQRLGALHAVRGSTPGSPNNMRTRIVLPDKAEILAPVMSNDPAVQLHSAKWNSDDFEPVNPLDKLEIDQTTGGIINVNAWHSNPGSRGNNPSASGIKGWNANTPVTRKMAGGFVVSVVEGRDAFYGGTKDGELPDVKLTRLNSPEKLPGEQASAAIMPSSAAEVELHRSMSTIDNMNFVQNMSKKIDLDQQGIPYVANEARMPDEPPPEEPMTGDSVNNMFKLIEAIDHEKMALGTIPRMQPEIVISKEHLDQLGHGQISIDKIATQIRWAKEKRVREHQKMLQSQSQESLSLSRSPKPSTSQSIGDLNYMTSYLDPVGGVGIQVNQFSDMDVEMGFRPNPTDVPPSDARQVPSDSLPGSPSLSRHTSTKDMSRMGSNMKNEFGKEDNSMLSFENPNEIKRLADAATRAPPRQLKSLTKAWVPGNPYKSLDEMTCIINYGVAAGMGMNVLMTDEMRKAKLIRWGQRGKTREGRFRTGGTSNTQQPGFSPDNEEHKERKRKKISKMLP